MKSEISATDAVRRFSEVLNRVQCRNETFIVTRRGEPMCEIVPVRPAAFTGRDLVGLLRSLPHPDKEYLDAVEDLVRNQPPAQRSRRPRWSIHRRSARPGRFFRATRSATLTQKDRGGATNGDQLASAAGSNCGPAR